MKVRVIFALWIAIVLAPVLSQAGEITIIANQSIKESNLSKKDIRRIFTGKKKFWDDRVRIVVVIQKDSAIHKSFLDTYVKKTPSQFASSWNKLIFSGKRSAPHSFEGDQNVAKYVSETQGAIGYVATDENFKKVKVISVK